MDRDWLTSPTPREDPPDHYVYEDDPFENTRPDIYVPVITDFELEYRTCRCACECSNDATHGRYCAECNPELEVLNGL